MSEEIKAHLGSSISRGTKVTTDPEAQNRPVEEGTGIITSDSLAAESLRSGGDFAANANKAPGISDQTSKGFTGNTPATPGARKVVGKDVDTSQESLDADLQYGKGAGVGPTYNATAAEKGTSSSAGVAPTIHSDNVDERVYQPKGLNLKESGEITGSEKNTSFTAEIGSMNDPGLAAEEKFQRINADQGATADYRKGDAVHQGGFENLDRDESA